jgi:hypothetical protein
MDPNVHHCVGYLTYFDGLGMSVPLAQDIAVSVPYNGPAPHYEAIFPTNQNTVHVVGVLEKFAWAGGVGDALEFDFWVSQENATRLKTLQQTTLKSTIIDPVGWWIADYDQETKQWYEKSFTQNSKVVTGIVANRDNPELNVDLTPVPAKDGIDVMVYKVSMAVVPGANQQYALSFANSSTQHVVKSWGLVVGTLSSAEYKGSV